MPCSWKGSRLCHHFTGCLILPPFLSGLFPFSILFPYSVLWTCLMNRSTHCPMPQPYKGDLPSLWHCCSELWHYFFLNDTPINPCNIPVKTVRMLCHCLQSKQNQCLKTLTLPLYTTYWKQSYFMDRSLACCLLEYMLTGSGIEK